MKVKDLIKLLQAQDPEATVIVSCEGYYYSEEIRVELTGDKTYRGVPVLTKGVVIKDDIAVEDLGIF